MADQNDKLFFRIAVGIVVAGSSCLAFVIAGFVKEQNSRLFRLLNHMAAGVSLGMALITLPNDAQASFGNNNDFMFNGLVTASAFIFMIVAEHLAAVGGFGELCLSSYSYQPLSVSDVDEEEEKEENGPRYDMNPNDDEDLSDERYDNEDYVGDVEMHTRSSSRLKPALSHIRNTNSSRKVNPLSDFQKRRFFPSCILFTVSIYEALYGGNLALNEHTGFGGYLQMVAQQLLLSFTFGLMLGFLLAPRRFFVMFMTIFSLSTSTGIFIGSFLLPESQRANVLYYKGYGAIISAGIFLYLSTIHILPAELLYDANVMSKSNESAVDDDNGGIIEDVEDPEPDEYNPWNERGKSVTAKILYLVMKVAALTIGFAMTALPVIVFELDEFIKHPGRPRSPVPPPKF